MNLIWNFAGPTVPSGYGVVSKEICSRIQADGHTIKIACRLNIGKPLNIEGLTVIDGRSSFMLDVITKDQGVDYIFCSQDPFCGYPSFLDKWVGLAILDVENAYPEYIDSISKAKFTWSVSRHNQEEFKKNGINSWYAPWGVDTKTFKPDEAARKVFRDSIGVNDNVFVLGVVATSLHSDRKNFLGLLKAFQIFNRTHKDAILYLHSNIIGGGGTKDFIRSSTGPIMHLGRFACDLGLEGKVTSCDQKRYWLWDITPEEMVATYNGLDAFILPTRGESFCIPAAEAQACGTPVISTDTCCMPEVVKDGWLIDLDEDEHMYADCGAWAANPRYSKIAAYMEKAYQAWKTGESKQMGLRSSKLIKKEFDWDVVYEKHWRPFLKMLEENIKK